MGQILFNPLNKNAIDTSFSNGTFKLSDVFSFVNKFEGLNIVEDVPYYYLDAQDEGGFVAFSLEYPGAVGQGETEDDAIQDIKSAIELLTEEESNPSRDIPWPKNFR